MSEINEKLKKLKNRIKLNEGIIDDHEDRLDRLNRLESQAFRSEKTEKTEKPFNPFAIFGLTPGVNLPPLGTRLEKDDLITLAKGLAINLGFKGKDSNPIVDAFFKAAIKDEEPETSDDETPEDE